MSNCSKCKDIHSRNGRYCLKCHAEYMRAWRQTTPLTQEQRFKDNARSYAGVYLRRGKLEKQPCELCGSGNSEMHHEEYSKPLEVNWLCRDCHLEYHA